MSTCVNPGLKTKAMISQKWEKQKNGHVLLITNLNIKTGYTRKLAKHGKYDVFCTLSKDSNVCIGTEIKSANEAMNLLQDYIGIS